MSGRLKDRQWQQDKSVGFVQDIGRHIAATSAIAAEAGPHREFGDVAHALVGRALDGFIGNAETNANVHGQSPLSYE